MRRANSLATSPKLPMMSRTETDFSGGSAASRMRANSKGRIQGFGQLTIQTGGRPVSRGGCSGWSSQDPSPKSPSDRMLKTASGFGFGGANAGTSRNRGLSISTTACESPTAAMNVSSLLEERNGKSGYMSPKSPKYKAGSGETPQSAAMQLAKCMQNAFPSSSSRPSSRSGSRPGTPSSQADLKSSLQGAAGLVLSRPSSQAGARPERPETSSGCWHGDRESPKGTLLLPDEFKSRLLQRRGSCPLAVDVAPANVIRQQQQQRKASETKSFEPKKTIRVLEEGEKIFDIYSWSKVLQEDGDGGKVVVCQPKPEYKAVPQKPYVMKFRSKKSLMDSAMEEQFRNSLLNLLNLPEHVGVLPVQEALEDDHFYYIVMEEATGGSFFAGLLSEFKDGIMPPSEVRRLMRSIIEAIGHVHRQGMLHRDIKPDNLVMRWCEDELSPTGKSRKVAIIDFDHADADYQASLRCQQEFCGTVYFAAPETFVGYFSQSSDLYSIGIIMYLLMAGKMPFDDSIFQEEMQVLQHSPKHRGWTSNVYRRMKSSEIDWGCDPWPSQPACADFCKWLLAFDPLKRPASADEALEHLWFAEMSP
eukprot:gb/GFBE01059608.1/.p1 GENE.gb/GFBE01059608.1/~~gb/GFBE01059608.1/.p1  ORF type:complete len:589 (+),score=108.36 gb/GFBE01059608.1/:1-1767(+)